MQLEQNQLTKVYIDTYTTEPLFIFHLWSRSVLAAKLLTHSAGQTHCRYPAGLSHHYVAGLWHSAPDQKLLQQELRDLGTLSTARLTSHHHHRVALQSLQDTMPMLEDWKLLSLSLKGGMLLDVYSLPHILNCPMCVCVYLQFAGQRGFLQCH